MMNYLTTAICLVRLFSSFTFLLFGTQYVETKVSEHTNRILRKALFKGEKGKRDVKNILKTTVHIMIYRSLALLALALYLWANGYFSVLFQTNGGVWEYVELIIKGIAFGIAISFFTTVMFSSIVRIADVRILGADTDGEEEVILEERIEIVVQRAFASVNEEFLFRGFLLLGLYSCLHYSMLEAIVIQALIFSLLHRTIIKNLVGFMSDLFFTNEIVSNVRLIQLSLTLLICSIYFIHGLILGILFVLEKNLIVPIIAHVLYNVFHDIYLQQYVEREVMTKLS